MDNDHNLRLIFDQLQILLLHFERPVVYLQASGIIIATLIAAVLTKSVWHYSYAPLFSWANKQADEERGQYQLGLTTLVEFLTLPVILLITLQITITFFEARGALATLIVQTRAFFWVFLVYRVIVALLYIFIGRSIFRRYHYRLLEPSFLLILCLFIFKGLIDLRVLGQITLLSLFSDPLTVADLFGAIIALYYLFTIAWVLQHTLQDYIAPRTTIEPGAISASLTLGRYLVICIGIFIVFAALGVDGTSLTVIGGGLSVGIGFGLQTIISNFISGIILLFEQSLRPGDIIEVDGVLGTVDKLSIRATTVRTFDNVEKIIPNETLFTSTVTTYTQSSRVTRVVMTIGVSYNSEPKEVMEILLAAAQEHGLVLEEPEPAVFFQDYNASSIDFHLAIWLADPSYLKRVPSDLRLMIWNEFEKRGIEIPFPQQDLHLRTGFPWEQVEKQPTDNLAVPHIPQGVAEPDTLKSTTSAQNISTNPEAEDFPDAAEH